jgi:hypothetical protein
MRDLEGRHNMSLFKCIHLWAKAMVTTKVGGQTTLTVTSIIADKRVYVRASAERSMSSPPVAASAGPSPALIFLLNGVRGARLVFKSARLRDVCSVLALDILALKTPSNARTLSMLLECTLTRQHGGVEQVEEVLGIFDTAGCFLLQLAFLALDTSQKRVLSWTQSTESSMGRRRAPRASRFSCALYYWYFFALFRGHEHSSLRPHTNTCALTGLRISVPRGKVGKFGCLWHCLNPIFRDPESKMKEMSVRATS